MKKRLLSIFLIGASLFSIILLCGCQSFRSLGASTGRCLITEDGRCLLTCDDTPIVLSNRSRDPDLFAGLSSGDEIRVVHDGIQETYPARTGVYSLHKLGNGGIEDISAGVLDNLLDMGWRFAGIEQTEEPTAPLFPTAVSWANYGDESLLWSRALNRDKAASNTSHRPVLRFDSVAELAAFKREISGAFDTRHDYDEIPSFDTVTAGMDEAFFADNSLLLVYVWSGSCTWRYGVNQVAVENDCLTVHVQRTDNFECGDCAMAGWFLTVSVPKEQLRNITSFDADLGNLVE